MVGSGRSSSQRSANAECTTYTLETYEVLSVVERLASVEWRSRWVYCCSWQFPGQSSGCCFGMLLLVNAQSTQTLVGGISLWAARFAGLCMLRSVGCSALVIEISQMSESLHFSLRSFEQLCEQITKAESRCKFVFQFTVKSQRGILVSVFNICISKCRIQSWFSSDRSEIPCLGHKYRSYTVGLLLLLQKGKCKWNI